MEMTRPNCHDVAVVRKTSRRLIDNRVGLARAIAVRAGNGRKVSQIAKMTIADKTN